MREAKRESFGPAHVALMTSHNPASHLIFFATANEDDKAEESKHFEAKCDPIKLFLYLRLGIERFSKEITKLFRA